MRTILIIDDLGVAHTDEIVRVLADVRGCRLLHATAPPALLPWLTGLPPLSEVLAEFNRQYDLTRRECELLLYQVRAPKATHADLAAQARLTRNSVKTYFKRIYRKLGITVDDAETEDATTRDERNGRKRTVMLQIFQQHFPSVAPQPLHVREVGNVLASDTWVDVS